MVGLCAAIVADVTEYKMNSTYIVIWDRSDLLEAQRKQVCSILLIKIFVHTLIRVQHDIIDEPEGSSSRSGPCGLSDEQGRRAYPGASNRSHV